MPMIVSGDSNDNKCKDEYRHRVSLHYSTACRSPSPTIRTSAMMPPDSDPVLANTSDYATLKELDDDDRYSDCDPNNTFIPLFCD